MVFFESSKACSFTTTLPYTSAICKKSVAKDCCSVGKTRVKKERRSRGRKWIHQREITKERRTNQLFKVRWRIAVQQRAKALQARKQKVRKQTQGVSSQFKSLLCSSQTTALLLFESREKESRDGWLTRLSTKVKKELPRLEQGLVACSKVK
jgi:hypothetical protein